MKKFLFMVLIIAFVCTASTVYAAERAPLGTGNLALKLDWIKFTGSTLKDLGADSAFYIGLEGYGEIAQNWYLGMEAGWAEPKGTVAGVESKMTYIPVELNIKYAGAVAQSVVIDVGAGLSYNYSKMKQSGLISSSGNKWLFGGQFFGDLNFTFDQFFIGISAKYQITQNFSDYDYNTNNWRLGGQLGVLF
jgi:hypothetical protein